MTGIVGQLNAERRAKVEKAVDALITNICGRSGLGNAWEETDEETQAEIRKVWIDLVLRWGP